jgi:hypothetical protein
MVCYTVKFTFSSYVLQHSKVLYIFFTCVQTVRTKFFSKGKGKIHPRTDHEGPEGEWTYNSTLPLTSALDGGGWSTPRPGSFTPGKDLVPIV